MKTGIEQIDEERARQIQQEGYGADHDDHHTNGELAYAGLAYEQTADAQVSGWRAPELHPRWPWEREWWKPDAHPVRNYQKAGALYRAEAQRASRGGLPDAVSYGGKMNAAAVRCGQKIDEIESSRALIIPPPMLSQQEVYAAMGILIAKIEKCGASTELTSAVVLAGDIRRAVGNRWNHPSEFAADQVRSAIQ